MIKGAIFDMDGTLLDSMSLWDRMGEEYLRFIGIEPREDVNYIFKSLSLYDAACFFRSDYGVTVPVDKIVDDINKTAAEFYKNKVLAKAGAVRFADRLYSQGVKMCIATSTDRPLVETALRRTGLRRYFGEIFTCDEVGHGKSEPVVYREAMKWLGTDRASTVVFEDALFAIKTLKADGFTVAAVRDRHQPYQDEVVALSDYYLTDFSDFESFLDFADR